MHHHSDHRDSPAAGNWSDCHPCPAGNFCPDTNATTNGTQCDRGYYCPEGSQLQTICQPGEGKKQNKTPNKMITIVLERYPDF